MGFFVFSSFFSFIECVSISVVLDNYHNREYIITNFTVNDVSVLDTTEVFEGTFPLKSLILRYSIFILQNKLTVSGEKMRSILPASLTNSYFTSVDIMGLPYKPVNVFILGTVGVLSSEQCIWDGRGKVITRWPPILC